MTDEDRVWDNGWGRALIYFAELEESLRRIVNKPPDLNFSDRAKEGE